MRTDDSLDLSTPGVEVEERLAKLEQTVQEQRQQGGNAQEVRAGRVQHLDLERDVNIKEFAEHLTVVEAEQIRDRARSRTDHLNDQVSILGDAGNNIFASFLYEKCLLSLVSYLISII